MTCPELNALDRSMFATRIAVHVVNVIGAAVIIAAVVAIISIGA